MFSLSRSGSGGLVRSRRSWAGIPRQGSRFTVFLRFWAAGLGSAQAVSSVQGQGSCTACMGAGDSGFVKLGGFPPSDSFGLAQAGF